MNQLPQLKIQEQSIRSQEQIPTASNKLFNISGIEVVYLNDFIVSQLDQQCDHVIVDNYLCKQNGNKLSKYTDIILNKIKIRIKDEFLLGSQQVEGQRIQPIKQKQKKLRIVRGPSQLQQFGEVQKHKRDTRNTVKNIVKLFNNWLALDQNNHHMRILLINILQGKKFNNSLIKELAQDGEINPLFTKFLQEDSTKFINNSKIKDKGSHINVAKCYLQILKNQRQKFQTKTFDS